MFRIEDGKDITDKECKEIISPYIKNIDEYIKNSFLYDFVAFCIASGYERNALWQTNLLTEYNTALEHLSDLHSLNAYNSAKIKKRLKVTHSLEVISENPLEVKKIQY